VSKLSIARRGCFGKFASESSFSVSKNASLPRE
jgi:hypothetical protein